MWNTNWRSLGWAVIIFLMGGLASLGAGASLACGRRAKPPAAATPNTGDPAPADSLTLDPAWHQQGGMLTGQFVDAQAQVDWPLWMQALIAERTGVPAQDLEQSDLFKIPDVYLPRAIGVLEANGIFSERILSQATAIGYTARADEWQPAKTSYQIAYVKAHGLPASDPLTASRLMTQLAYQNEFDLLRAAVKETKWPATAQQSLLRMMDIQQRRALPRPEAVMDASRPANERLYLFLSLDRPANPEKLLLTLKGTDVYDLAVFHAVTRGWIDLGSPRVDEAMRMQKTPDESTLWFLAHPEERVSDLLWMRAMEALKKGNRKVAIAQARTIVAHYAQSWFAGHAAYLLAGLDPSFHAMPEPALRVPGDITLFNAERVKTGLKPLVQEWPEPYKKLAALNRFDLILAQADPEKEPEVFLHAAYEAGQQDLVSRFQSAGRACSSETAPYLYPVFLKALVERLIREEGLSGSVDAAFVLAMIKNESGFQPGARSGSEAFGIMQLLKPTFAHMVGLSADILNPETNIRAGLRYYRTVINTAHLEAMPVKVRMAYILAGYHAGEGRARRWRIANEAKLRGQDTPTAMMLRIDAVPITSTRHYILRVMGDRELFRSVLGD
jgi:soluble lytic murein transglycosylase-like protein